MAIGVISTAAYAALYLTLRSVMGSVVANAVALTVTAVANTAANRRVTFGVRRGGRASMLRDQAAGLAALGVALAITTVTANVLAVVAPHAGSSVRARRPRRCERVRDGRPLHPPQGLDRPRRAASHQPHHRTNQQPLVTTISPPTAEPRLTSRPRLLRWLARARGRDATWVLPATVGVLLLAARLYLVNLTVSGYANVYYSAAAWAASQDWSAWFFGSIDPSNFITVDKPPLATMVLGLSIRLFGLSSASILVPQALMGVASVGLLMATVRRTFGAPPAIIAGLVWP